MRRIRSFFVAGCAALALASSGCPHGGNREALSTALRYLDAAAAGDVETCYGLLSEEAQRGCDRACLASILEQQRAEFRAARDELRASLREKAPSRNVVASHSATLQLRDGSQLHLAQAPQPVTGQARKSASAQPYLFSQNPLQFYPQDTPEHTLRSFLLAVERRRWDVLVSFLPRSLSQPAQGPFYTAEQVQKRFEGPAAADIARQLNNLRAHLNDAIQILPSGNEAALKVGENREARLVFEDGAWRVRQLE